MEEKQKSVGALWLKTSKKGLKYMSGKVGETDIVVFKNNYKEKDNQPDYLIYKSEPRNDNTTNRLKEGEVEEPIREEPTN